MNCPFCSYDLSGHELPTTCPECGKNVFSALFNEDLEKECSARVIFGRATWPVLIIPLGAWCYFPFNPGSMIAAFGFLIMAFGIVTFLFWSSRRTLNTVFVHKEYIEWWRERGQLLRIRLMVVAIFALAFGLFALAVSFCLYLLENFKI